MVLIACNLIFPIYINNKFGFYSVFQWVIIIIATYGLTVAFGIFDQGIPMLQTFFLRLAQMGLHTFIFKTHINWNYYGILLVLDVLFYALMIMDKRNYEYIREEVK
ncbi:hypothetical protein [Paraclostridium bifermentans]|uniref:hypothetical protein n=1 Tax=Paraclostridium bifermentans TaxID=1490 RepID=UPI00374E3C2D